MTGITQVINWLAFLMVVFAFPGSELLEQDSARIDARSSEILANCIEAMGGEMALASIGPFVVNGKLTTGTGGTEEHNTPVDFRIDGDRFWMSVHGGLNAIFDGQHEWNGVGHATRLASNNETIQFHQCFPFPSMLNIARTRAKTIKFQGETTFNGEDAFKVLFQLPDDARVERFYATQSGLLLGMEMVVSGDERLKFVYEWKVNNEIQWLHRMTMFRENTPHQKTLFEMDYEFDAEIDASLFAMPDVVKIQVADKKAAQRNLERQADEISMKPESGQVEKDKQ